MEFTINTGNVQKKIGKDQPCFTIAEVGVNHNGSLEKAKEMIKVAAEAGVDAVKFQVLTAAGLYVEDAGKDPIGRDAYAIWKDVEVPFDWIPQLKQCAEENGVIFFTSVFDLPTVDKIDPYVGLYKIASSETSDIALLKKVARTKKPVIFSVGGATMEEVEEAVNAVKEEGNNQIAILFCVQQYPTPLNQANVLAVKTLQQKFPDVVVGYSDHSMNPGAIPSAAVSLGGRIIEKHFTLDRNTLGIDHHMSLEPQEVAEMVKDIRETENKIKQGENINIPEEMLGDGQIVLTEKQKDTLQFVRRKIFVIKDINAGEILTQENIATLRPGNRDTTNGIHPREYMKILGKKAARNLSRLNLLKREDITS